MPFALLLLLLGVGASTSLSAQPLDSLRLRVETAETPDEQLDAMLTLSRYYQMRSHDSTEILYQQIEELAGEEKDYDALVQLAVNKGMYSHNKGKLQEALAIYHAGLQLAQQHNLTWQLGSLCNNLAIAHNRGFRLDSAFYYYTQAEKYYVANQQDYEIWRTYWGLAQLYEERGEMEKSMEYGRKALVILEDRGSRADYGFFLYGLFALAVRNELFELAAEVREKWGALQEQSKTSKEIIEMPEHMSFFSFSNEPDTLQEARLIRSIAHHDSTGNVFSRAMCYEDLGKFNLNRGSYEKAEPALLQARSLYAEMGNAIRQVRILNDLYQLAEKKGNDGKAIEYLLAFYQMRDSLYGIDTEQHLQELEIQYETEKKEQALRINQLELRQKTQERNILMGSSVFLALLAVLIFFGLRLRLQTNKQLALQEQQIQEQRIQQLQQKQQLLSYNAMIEGQEKERMRIAKDLHDGLGGLLTTVKAHFSALAPAGNELAEKTNQLIDTACVEVRRIAHNMMPNTLLLSGLAGALEDLSGQLETSGLDCHLELLGPVDQLGQTPSVMVYRIIQELIQNIQKHAQAGQVLIQLLGHQNEMTLIVEDDGRGFNFAEAQSTSSLGLQSIESRVRYLQGSWDVDSVLGEGTTVTIRFPIRQ